METTVDGGAVWSIADPQTRAKRSRTYLRRRRRRRRDLGVYMSPKGVSVWEGLTIDSVCLSTLLLWSQFERLAVDKIDKRPAFRWSQNVLIDVSVPYWCTSGTHFNNGKSARLEAGSGPLRMYDTGRDSYPIDREKLSLWEQ